MKTVFDRLTLPERKIGEGAYTEVFESTDTVLKVARSRYVTPDIVRKNHRVLENRDIPHAQTTYFRMDEPGTYDDVMVFLQERQDAPVTDQISDLVTLLDDAVERGVVLCDAKPENFGVFDGDVKLVDTADDEMFIAYYQDTAYDGVHRDTGSIVAGYDAVPDSAIDTFRKDCAVMYDGVSRSYARRTGQEWTDLMQDVALAADHLEDRFYTSYSDVMSGVTLDLDDIYDDLPRQSDGQHELYEQWADRWGDDSGVKPV